MKINRTIFAALTLCSLFCAISFTQTGGSFAITESVLSNGGGGSSSGNFAVTGTNGQTQAGTQMANGSFGVSGGFWNFAGSVPIVTTLAASFVTATSATLNGAANPNGEATTGWFRYSSSDPGSCNDMFGTRAPIMGGTGLGSGSMPVQYSEAITGLMPGATYYYCAIAANGSGTSFGSVLSFKAGGSPPDVTTTAASSVTVMSATLNGFANSNGDPTTGWFRYSSSDPGMCNDMFGTRAPLMGGIPIGSNPMPVDYSQGISGLNPGTTYYFCAIASNGSGISFGSVLSFIAAPSNSPPSVNTLAATSVTVMSATLNASANPNGDNTTGWFRYSVMNPGMCNDTFGTRAPVMGGSSLGSGTMPVAYSEGIGGLNAGSTYYYCAIASNGFGLSFGSVLSFVAAPSGSAPSVNTLAATSVTVMSATLNASANPNGDNTTGWFRYSVMNPGMCNDTFGTRAPVMGGSSLGSGTMPVAYSEGIGGLNAGSTYYYCAIASNGFGLSFGSVLSFVAAPSGSAPSVNTLAATSVTVMSATLNGSANPNGDNTTGWFRYSVMNPGMCNDTFGTRAPVMGGSSLGSGTMPVAYSEGIGGLNAGSTYYYCAIASNGFGLSFGSVLSFVAAPSGSAPSVNTLAATSVTVMSATLNGSANPNGDNTTGWFRYSVMNPGMCNDSFGTRAPIMGGLALGSGVMPVAYSEGIGGLNAGSTYYYCAIASNAFGTSFGSVLSFVAAPQATVSGAITYGNAIGSPMPPRFVKNVSLSSTTGMPPVGPVITGTPGTYTLTAFGSGSYTIKPTKTGGATTAITSNDAARVAQGVSGALAFVSQNQRFAADVTGNGNISSQDAAKIAQFVAGLPFSPPNLTGQWKFFVTGAPSPLPTPPQVYDDSRSYASVSGNLTGEDFVGILVGEVSGNYNTATHPRPVGSRQLAFGSEDIRETAKPITVTAQDVVTATDKEIIIPVNIEGVIGKQIISYEFDLRYDPAVMQPSVEAVDVKGTVSRALSVVVNAIEPGRLRVVVYGALPIQQDGVLLNLRFTTVGTVGSLSALTFDRIMFNEGESQIILNDGEVRLF